MRNLRRLPWRASGGRNGECYTFVKARSKAKTTTNGQAVRWPQMRIGFDWPINRSLLAEAETSHEIYESRIAPKWIKLRADQHDWLKASLVGLLEPVHCLVMSPETHIDQRNVGIEGSVVVLQLR